jgi:hypothetical protein
MRWSPRLAAETMPIQAENPGSINAPGSERQKRRSLLGRAFRGIGWLSSGPVDWAGLRGISRSASLIRNLSATLRTGSRRDLRFRTGGDGGFDLNSTAFLYGISVPELERHLKARRRQTALIAYATFALACFFLTAWVCEALSSPWTATRIALALEFLPFCALFFLLAFYHALLNFQIRIGRTASWREYLATSAPFWPR